MKKIISATLLLTVLYSLVIYLLSLANLPLGLTVITLVLAMLAVTKLVFNIIDYYFPRPSNLSLDEVKSFFRSKIFWLAFLNLIAVILKGLFDIDLDEETTDTILNLNWQNALQAIMSILIIVIRKFDILKFLD